MSTGKKIENVKSIGFESYIRYLIYFESVNLFSFALYTLNVIGHVSECLNLYIIIDNLPIVNNSLVNIINLKRI